MKRILYITVAISLMLLLSINIYANDIADFEKEISENLSDNSAVGISYSDMEEINLNRVFEYIKPIIGNSIKVPIKIIAIITLISLIGKVCEILSNNKQIYDSIFTLIAFVAISSVMISAFDDICAAMLSAQGFLIAYIPIFASVISLSGNIALASSYNAILLYACEGATAALSLIVKPLLCCMMVTSIIRSLNPAMPDVTSAIRRLTVTFTGFIMSIFLGVIGLQGIVGKTQDSLTVKAGKYLISSFVPIIGLSLNESYRTVKQSVDTIRSYVGAFGIVIVLAVLIIPIIKSFVFRWTFILCEFISSAVECTGIQALSKSLSEVFLLLNTLVILYTLMLIIATGGIIALGGSTT